MHDGDLNLNIVITYFLMKNTLILLIFIMLTGCSGYYYTASPHYVPLNSEKRELKANIGLYNLQAGYTISNHL